MNKLEKYHSKGIEKYKDTSEIIQKQNKSSNKKKKNIFSNIIQAEKKQKEKVKTEIKSAFTDRIKLISPGPGFYQLNFANMINGPVIK